MMVPNFLYSNSYNFFNIIIIIIIIIIFLHIIIIILIFLVPPYFALGGKAIPSQPFFTISKQNLINILFHRGNFVKNRK